MRTAQTNRMVRAMMLGLGLAVVAGGLSMASGCTLKKPHLFMQPGRLERVTARKFDVGMDRARIEKRLRKLRYEPIEVDWYIVDGPAGDERYLDSTEALTRQITLRDMGIVAGVRKEVDTLDGNPLIVQVEQRGRRRLESRYERRGIMVLTFDQYDKLESMRFEAQQPEMWAERIGTFERTE